jgi:hypothetical protein
MATSGSTSVAVTAYDTLRFSWWVINQSIENNRTFIGWSLELVASTNGYISSTAAKDWSVTVNGTNYSGTNTVGIASNATKTLASGQTVVNHNTDGSKVFTYAFSQEFNITFGGASVGTKTGSGTGVLDTLPRATTPGVSATTVEMGETMVIYTAGTSSKFTHDLAYAFAGGSYVSIETGVVSSTYWKVPLDLASSVPNATSGTVTIRCITKNGSTVVGTKTVLVTAKVPASIIPTISTVTHVEAATGVAEAVGVYVQGKTQVGVNITAAGAYGSTVKSYTSTLLGKSYQGANWTSGTLNQSGTLSIVTTVTDSRGRTASKTTNITVLAYTPPSISTFSVARADSSGNATTDGTYIRARTVYSVATLSGANTASAKLEYRRAGTTYWSNLVAYTSLSMDATLTPKGSTFSTDYEWEFRLTLTDAFSSAMYTALLPSGAVILDIKADGKGLAFFKTSTKDGVEIAGELPGSAIQLQSNANLNSLTTPGFYVIPTTTISGTITNKPYTDTATASIRVERTGSTSYRQTVQKSTKTDGVIYERGYESGSWGSWSVVYSGAGKLLWSGSNLMTSGQTVNLSELISVQQSGIVLVFSRYISNAAVDYYYSCHFVPKQLVPTALSAGQTSAAVSFMMATGKFEAVAAKYLYIKDDIIGGNDSNNSSGTANGVTYSNGSYALRYVIGV